MKRGSGKITFCFQRCVCASCHDGGPEDNLILSSYIISYMDMTSVEDGSFPQTGGTRARLWERLLLLDELSSKQDFCWVTMITRSASHGASFAAFMTICKLVRP